MNTTSLNESRIIKLSKAEPASQNNWKNYISTCAGSVSSLTSSGGTEGGTLGKLINGVTSNLMGEYLAPPEGGDYLSFLTGKSGLLSTVSIGNTFNVDPEVQLVANGDWRISTIRNDYDRVIESNKTPSKSLTEGSSGGFLKGVVSGAKDFLGGTFQNILNGAAGVSSVTGSNKSLYNYSTQTWWKNLKGWTGTDPISIQLTFDFAMGQYGLWNAKKEVVLPMLNLIAMFCPSLIADGSMIGPTATPTGMLYSIIGEKVAEAFEGVEDIVTKKDTGTVTNFVEGATSWVEDTFNSGAEGGDPSAPEGESKITSTLNGAASLLGGLTAAATSEVSSELLKVLRNSTYNVQIGNFMSISNCICTGINNTSFSNKVDESGYPIAGSISLVLQGVIPPTFSGTRADLVTLRFGGF